MNINSPVNTNERAVSREKLDLPLPYAPASNSIEQNVIEVYSRILRVAPVGLDDEFFDLGGDSLQGEQISLEIEQILGKNFPISTLFYSGTPRKIAKLASTELVNPLQAGKPVLFIVHGKRGYTLPNNDFLDILNRYATIEMFEMPGIRGTEKPLKSLQEISKAYCDHIDALQPTGDVFLSSFCAGGMIAIDMIRELSKRGRSFGGIALIDPSIPSEKINALYARYSIAQSGWQRFAARLFGFFSAGRWSEDQPFLETAYRKFYARKYILKQSKYLNLANRSNRYGNTELNAEAQAWLFASYRTARLSPVRQNVHVLASDGRVKRLMDPDGAWSYLIPKLNVKVIAQNHNHLFNQDVETMARAVVELLFKGNVENTEKQINEVISS